MWKQNTPGVIYHILLCSNCLCTQKQVKTTSSCRKSSCTQKRSPASPLVSPSMTETPNLTLPVSWPMTSNSFQSKQPFKNFKLLPPTKGGTSWHKLRRFHCSCCITHCCTGLVAMKGCTLSSFFVPSYFSPFQARLDNDYSPHQENLVRWGSQVARWTNWALHLLPYKKLWKTA